MNRNLLISIIMPVYNSEKYLSEAINSVLNQSYTNFELLLIDDGSTDNSFSICNNIAQNDSRILVYHKENGGVCSARNFGIEKARGEYITFIDNDDIYDKNFLLTMVNFINKNECDIIKCGRTNIFLDDDKIINKKVFKWKNIEYSRDTFYENYCKLKETGILSSVWNGLYSSQFLKQNKILFNTDFKHGNEDILFNMICYQCIKKISFVESSLYNHFYRNSHSTSLKYDFSQITTRLQVLEIENELLDKLSNENDKQVIILKNIKQLFKLLITSKKIEDRQKGISTIEESSYYYKFKTIKLFSIKGLKFKELIELIIIKLRFYRLYFFIYNLKR